MTSQTLDAVAEIEIFGQKWGFVLFTLHYITLHYIRFFNVA